MSQTTIPRLYPTATGDESHGSNLCRQMLCFHMAHSRRHGNVLGGGNDTNVYGGWLLGTRRVAVLGPVQWQFSPLLCVDDSVRMVASSHSKQGVDGTGLFAWTSTAHGMGHGTGGLALAAHESHWMDVLVWTLAFGLWCQSFYRVWTWRTRQNLSMGVFSCRTLGDLCFRLCVHDYDLSQNQNWRKGVWKIQFQNQTRVYCGRL